MVRHLLVVIAAVVSGCFAIMPLLWASEYSPPGIYDVQHVVLENGMRLILKPRTETRSVSLRLAVDINTRDFPCGKRETPHFLEHLMFAGTTAHDEAELDELIVANGGSWNATAGSEETIYELDIYSKYATLGLDTLYEIMTSSVIAASDVEDVRDIVHREMGGKPSELTQWLYLRGIGQGGAAKAVQGLFPGDQFICPGIETAEGIDREGVLRARDEFYVPDNMTLVVVGDFDTASMLGRIRETFGQLSSVPGTRTSVQAPRIPHERITTAGLLEPLVDNGAEVGFVFRIPGIESPDHFAFRVLEEYLEIRLYEAIRIEAALSYAPEVIHASAPGRGLLAVSTDVDIGSMDEALVIIQQEIQQLVDGPLDPAVLETTKRGILLASVWALETNAGFADYYAASRRELETRGALIDEEAEIARVTSADVFRIAKEYLGSDRGAVYRSAPTLTYVQLYAGIGIAILAAMMSIGGFYWRRIRRKPASGNALGVGSSVP